MSAYASHRRDFGVEWCIFYYISVPGSCIYLSARPEYSRTSSDRGHQGFQQGQSLLNALPAQSSSYAPSVQGSSAPSASAGHSGARGSLQFPSPVPGSCYECGEFGHIKRQCPRLRGGQFQQRGQPSSSAPVSSAPAQSARDGGQASRGRPRGGGRSGCGQARFMQFQ
uniref:DNA-binding protein HEXBP-like n=1 Tax=Nicotiana sylvestris TaxID=4096 RepID=A0A1U7VHE7_NICSY